MIRIAARIDDRALEVSRGAPSFGKAQSDHAAGDPAIKCASGILLKCGVWRSAMIRTLLC